MLGTAQTDTLSAERSSLLSVSGCVGIGSYAELLILVSQLHDTAEVAAVGVGGNGRDEAVIDITGRAVERNAVALLKYLAGEGKLLVFLVHLDVAAAGYAAGTHSAGNNGSVRGLTAANGEYTLSILHTLDVLRRGLETNENNLLALLSVLNGVLGCEYDSTGGSSGRSGDTLTDNIVFVSFLKSLSVKGRMEQHVERLSVDLHESFFLADHTFVDEVAGNLYSGGSGTLAVTGLEHIELFILDGELHILHIAVVIFESIANADELVVNLREDFLHL